MEISLEEYGKLSDRITELMLENERLRRIVFLTQSWISVKDRLPEHDGEVLAYCGGNIFIANCPEDEWVVYCLEEGGYSETCHVQVDYWMPLPEPPEVEDADD